MMRGNAMDINDVLRLCREKGSNITDKDIETIHKGLFRFHLVGGIYVNYKLNINKKAKTVVAYSNEGHEYYNRKGRGLKNDLLVEYVRDLYGRSGEFNGSSLDLNYISYDSKYLSDYTFTGIARCNKDDKFNIELGIKLATSRLEYKVSNTLIRKIELFNKYYINTLVKCLAKDTNTLSNKSKEWKSDIDTAIKKIEDING